MSYDCGWKDESRAIIACSCGFNVRNNSFISPLFVHRIARDLFGDLSFDMRPTIWYCMNCIAIMISDWLEWKKFWRIWVDTIRDHKWENGGIWISFARICPDHSIDSICSVQVHLVPHRDRKGCVFCCSQKNSPLHFPLLMVPSPVSTFDRTSTRFHPSNRSP
jgi:hypothetical protein